MVLEDPHSPRAGHIHIKNQCFLSLEGLFPEVVNVSAPQVQIEKLNGSTRLQQYSILTQSSPTSPLTKEGWEKGQEGEKEEGTEGKWEGGRNLCF